MPNNNRCVFCDEIIPEGLQLCPKCFAVGEKPKEKIIIEMDINAVPSEMTARVMLRLIKNYCKQYGKRISVDYSNGKLDFEDKNAPIVIPPLKISRADIKRINEQIEKHFKKCAEICNGTSRKNEKGIYYTAELLDTKHGKSVLHCTLKDIEVEE